MKPIAYKVLWLSALLVLVCTASTIPAQSARPGDQPATLGGQAGGTPGQEGMEGMRRGQAGMGGTKQEK